MATRIDHDYSREAAVLARLLRPALPPIGSPRAGWCQPAPDELVYLGCAEVCLAGDVGIAELTQDAGLRLRLRAAAQGEDVYQAQADEIGLRRDLRVAVYLPIDRLDPVDQARYRLRVLLVNSHGMLEGSGHDWAVSVGELLAFRYWNEAGAQRAHWEDGEEGWSPKSPTLSLLLDAGVDLEPWCGACDPGDCERLPPHDGPFAWVRASDLPRQLFGLTLQEMGPEAGEIHLVLAYALAGLRAGQPSAWEALLFLADVLGDDAAEFAQSRAVLADRVAGLPAMAEYAVALRDCADLEGINTVLTRLYEDATQKGVWVVS